MRIAIILFILAAILLAGGFYAYTSAPPEANAATALIVPGVSAVILITLGLLLMAASARGRTVAARRLHIAGMVLALAYAAAFAHRAQAAGVEVRAHEEAASQFEELVGEGLEENTEENRRAFFEELEAPQYSKAYLTGTLWTLSGFAFVTFLALLFTRPGKPAPSPSPSPSAE
ncbi:MAG: hypothetical protein EA376_00755 [Phycisphaeraceae bacterium]|nr:MAG: hypothetical protein EA376_00755 [Phycisphaeraceae bacterium]